MFLQLFAFFNATAKPVGILLKILQPLMGRGRGGIKKTTKEKRSFLAAYDTGKVETEFRPTDVVST